MRGINNQNLVKQRVARHSGSQCRQSCWIELLPLVEVRSFTELVVKSIATRHHDLEHHASIARCSVRPVLDSHSRRGGGQDPLSTLDTVYWWSVSAMGQSIMLQMALVEYFTHVIDWSQKVLILTRSGYVLSDSLDVAPQFASKRSF